MSPSLGDVGAQPLPQPDVGALVEQVEVEVAEQGRAAAGVVEDLHAMRSRRPRTGMLSQSGRLFIS